MDLGTYSYFLIIFGGFGLVWGYRKGIGSKKQISDFEYLGFSAFWGVMVTAGMQGLLEKDPNKLSEFFKNGYVAGASLFLFALLLGLGIGWVLTLIRGLIGNLRR